MPPSSFAPTLEDAAPIHIKLRGYIRNIADKCAILDGCDPAAWRALPAQYFYAGVRRYVDGPRTSCTVRTTAATTYAGRATEPPPTLADLPGCYVSIAAVITAYHFHSAAGEPIVGWTITARRIKKIPAIEL